MDARLILAAAEVGDAVPPVWRGAAMLAALEDLSVEDVGAWPVGARDAALLGWRARLVGPEIEAVAQCPACDEALDFAFVPELAPVDRAAPGPSTADVAAALASPDPRAALAAFERTGWAHAALGEVWLDCPACAHHFLLLLDPGSLLAEELRMKAARLLGEVVALARAFGWREADILALSASRRAAYLAAVA